MAEADRGAGGSPRGTRELMPPATGRRQRVVRALLDEFEAWGYGRVATPLVEYYDVIARGLTEADRAQCVRFIEAGTGTVVALRADVTPQIARMAAGRLGGELEAEAVHRFCYAADVVRQPSAPGEQTEQHQVGVELIGAGDVWADVELVALCAAALRRVGLADFSIDIAHAQLAGAVIDALALPADVRTRVHGRLARKDRDGVEAVLRDAGLSAGPAGAVASLCDRMGPPDIVARAREELGALLPAPIIASLGALVDAIGQYDATLASSLVVDLGETRGFDYYSGARLRVWVPGVPRPVVRGGRYDGMLGRYGASRPATGFAIDLDALDRALGDRGGEVAGAAAIHLVVVDPSVGSMHGQLGGLAADAARHARTAGLRAWVQHARDEDGARAAADRVGARYLSWIIADGDVLRVRVWTREADGWQRTEQGNEAP